MGGDPTSPPGGGFGGPQRASASACLRLGGLACPGPPRPTTGGRGFTYRAAQRPSGPCPPALQQVGLGVHRPGAGSAARPAQGRAGLGAGRPGCTASAASPLSQSPALPPYPVPTSWGLRLFIHLIPGTLRSAASFAALVFERVAWRGGVRLRVVLLSLLLGCGHKTEEPAAVQRSRRGRRVDEMLSKGGRSHAPPVTEYPAAVPRALQADERGGGGA